MTCTEVKKLLSAFIDGELDPATSQEVERHLEGCPSCLSEVNRLQWLSKSLAEPPMVYPAPPGFEGKIRRAILLESGVHRPRIPHPSLIVAVAFSIFVVVGVTWWIAANVSGISRSDLIVQEIVQSHLRSLMADHLIDVVSSDQHTVKPWFDGKVDFSPTVRDLSADGFVLAGGRLDYVDNRPVAVIVYKRRLHVINLFSWPTTHPDEEAFSPATDNGYHIVAWHKEGMTYYAVSDVNESDLYEFVKAFLR